ncbi:MULTISPECIES: M15 family metallopeptidase [Coprobacillaceae]|uniref:M15 family metallopeptidase n=1 Tax=Coprobacillaceae TaxID=2810280 RepID=UPI001F3B3DA2|nr:MULTISPECIES: M15 family metallopeptidase [Coprobacillaceae]
MKLKRWHLYGIAFICFILAFTALNYKYDRFYRVNGINNDNRALIERYLDKQEQNYLIDNAIPVNQFIDYITYDQFKLQNYTYYNSLRKVKTYSDLSVLLDETNKIVDKLTVEFGNHIDTNFNLLIKNNLAFAYLNSEYFDFDNIEYYQLLRTLYDDSDYNYIALTNRYVSIFEEENLTSRIIYHHFKSMIDTYDANGVATLMTNTLKDGAKRLYKIDLMKQVVNNQTFISSYQPKKLTMIADIPRLSYTMYLQDEAYNQLKSMYKAMNTELDHGFIVSKAYTSYDVLSLEGDQAGYSEMQLGTSVILKKKGISDQDFNQTDVYQWLINHSYEYGYILRYPQDKEAVTGHGYDATCFRYVGIDIATSLHQNQLALEEYQE